MSSRTKASGVADAGAKADSIRQRTLHESSDQGCLPVHNGVLPSEEKVPQKQSGSQCSLHVWSRKTLLNRKDIPKHLQFNPYIETGYRPLLSAWGCIMSLFYFHNETINIITHGVPMLYILLRWRTLLPWSEITVPLLPWTHLVSTVSPWVGSTIYHLFMNHRAGETCYKSLLHLDMFGIWITQSFGALTTVYASVFCLSEAWIWKVLVVYCFVSLWCLYKIYSSRGRRPSSGHSLCHAGKSPPKPRPVRMYLLHGVSPSSMLLCLTLLPSLSSFVIPKGFPFSSRRISLLCRVVFGNLSVQQGGIQQRGGAGAVPSFSLREVVLILGPVFDGPIVSF
ncbi:uncharacterized protein LOC122247817 isoform X2 [Penaeus japonicus]|uniref:uncharacterized protein LOC122247817 isoform X2 n=1 Tax=Penaeus japonicus TaxID=27405 RepID=UPI001C71766D|nr:uncharacterized protein LOC122247817 isoform X2 [Penaeus japonicus]